jgi:hypothetical protein
VLVDGADAAGAGDIVPSKLLPPEEVLEKPGGALPVAFNSFVLDAICVKQASITAEDTIPGVGANRRKA